VHAKRTCLPLDFPRANPQWSNFNLISGQLNTTPTPLTPILLSYFLPPTAQPIQVKSLSPLHSIFLYHIGFRVRSNENSEFPKTPCAYTSATKNYIRGASSKLQIRERMNNEKVTMGEISALQAKVMLSSSLLASKYVALAGLPFSSSARIYKIHKYLRL